MKPSWKLDCWRWRGRVLRGRHAHWCHDWDGLPVDETTPEWPCACYRADALPRGRTGGHGGGGRASRRGGTWSRRYTRWTPLHAPGDFEAVRARADALWSAIPRAEDAAPGAVRLNELRQALMDASSIDAFELAGIPTVPPPPHASPSQGDHGDTDSGAGS